MERCALEFIARRWWHRAEVWVIATLLVAGGAVLGWQSVFWSMASIQANRVAQDRERRDQSVEAVTTATQAADKADEALKQVSP